NALDIVRDHQLDAGTKLRVRRLLPAGALAPALPAHRGHKTAFLHVAALDGKFAPALEAGVRPLAKFFIEEEADMRRRDLVGGDVIAQLGIVLRVPGVPGQVLAGQLPPDQFRIFRKEKYPSLKLALAGALLDGAGKQRRFHKQNSSKIDGGLQAKSG